MKIVEILNALRSELIEAALKTPRSEWRIKVV